MSVDHEKEQRVEERRRRYFTETVGVPEVHLRLLRDRPDDVDHDKPAFREAAAWLSEMDAKPWLLLAGPPGLGKSLSAAWLALKLSREDPEASWDPRVPRPRGARIVPAIEVAALAPWDRELSRLAETSSALILDDVGNGFTDERGHGRMKLESVASPRYDALRPLVVTTNLRFSDFEAAHPRVADRFFEVGRVVELDGRSLRRPK
jgi:DNA replication protein DnaC